MTQPDPILPVLADDELSERAAAVFDDIRATRNTDFVNNIWRVLANDPNLLEQTWSEVKNTLTEDSELDVLTKQLIYIAVSVAQNCNYCIRSHTAAARALGLTDAQLAELHTVIGLAAKTNRLAQGLQVPIDEAAKDSASPPFRRLSTPGHTLPSAPATPQKLRKPRRRLEVGRGVTLWT